MKAPAMVVIGLLPLFLTACIHRKPQVQAQGQTPPVIVDNPPLPPSTASVNPPAGETSIPAKPTTTAPTPPKPDTKRKKPASKPATTPANATAPTQEAANAAPAAVSAIGELSSGDPADYRQETSDSIAAIERSLNGITRPLNDSEQKTADHIREFLKQARAALASGDVDGAHTLASKARVLLNELTQ
jgi:hypothetical protein